jgi:hypothetical protein
MDIAPLLMDKACPKSKTVIHRFTLLPYPINLY